MATSGYEVIMYRDITRIADSLQRIAAQLERVADACENGDPPQPRGHQDDAGDDDAGDDAGA